MNSGIFVFGNDNLMVSYNRIGNIFKNRVLVCLERHIRVRLCKLPCQRYVRLIFLKGVGHVCFKSGSEFVREPPRSAYKQESRS